MKVPELTEGKTTRWFNASTNIFHPVCTERIVREPEPKAKAKQWDKKNHLKNWFRFGYDCVLVKQRMNDSDWLLQLRERSHPEVASQHTCNDTHTQYRQRRAESESVCAGLSATRMRPGQIIRSKSTAGRGRCTMLKTRMNDVYLV